MPGHLDCTETGAGADVEHCLPGAEIEQAEITVARRDLSRGLPNSF
jgi:hypothetical protein